MSYWSMVTVLALVRLTKKRFDHYAILKRLSLRSPSSSEGHTMREHFSRANVSSATSEMREWKSSFRLHQCSISAQSIGRKVISLKHV